MMGSVTYTFSNGSVANADEVNQNFSDVSFTDLHITTNTGGYTASTAWGIIGDASVSFTLSTTKSVMLEGFVPLYINSSDSSSRTAYLRLNINDANYVGTTSADGWSGGPQRTTLVSMYATTLAAGTYKVKLEWKKDSTNAYVGNDTGTRTILTAKILPRTVTIHVG